jgi:hypothetical protein
MDREGGQSVDCHDIGQFIPAPSYSKSKRRDVLIVDVIIPTNLVCVLFGPAIKKAQRI